MKARRVLVSGEIIETSLPPKYIFGKYEKENGIWYYSLKASIFTKYIGCRTRVVVSRYTTEQMEHKLEIHRRFAKPGSLGAALKRYRFKKFKETLGPVVELKLIDSVDEWLVHLDTEIMSYDFKVAKMREILTR